MTELLVKLHVPPVFQKLFIPRRYKVMFGGRGAGKSLNIAAIIVWLLYSRKPIDGQPFRVLCGREYQNSLSDSVHFELVGAIQRLGLVPYFKISGNSIVCRTTGAQVVYRGLHNNVDQLKSLGGIDLFWGEEAHSLTEDSLIFIDPTIRRDPPFGPFGKGSELWFTFNQTLDDDPVYTTYKCHLGAWGDDQHMIIPCTWKDNYVLFGSKNEPNPMTRARAAFPNLPDDKFIDYGNVVKVITFPEVLDKQRRSMEENDDKGYYDWVWGTACRNLGGIFFAIENMLLNGQPIEYPKICDAVYAVIDTASKTGNEHDGTAVMYFAINRHGAGFPLMILDYDIQKIEGSLLEHWLPGVLARCKELAEQCHARMGSLGAFIEDKNSGTVLLQQATRRNLPATAIDSKLTAMGKVERGISVSGYVYRSMIKFTRHAYDKVVPYKGVTLNHALTQIRSFRVGNKDQDQDDLLDVFCYGIAIGLGNPEGF
jgi:hypothetical protein